MIKSIFVDPLRIEDIEKSRANHLIVTLNGLDRKIWQKLRLHPNVGLSPNKGANVTISVTAFEAGGCPANPKALEKVISRLNQALSFKPAEIWLDHFRFDGHWEAVEDQNIPGIHDKCRWCKDKNRVQLLAEIAYQLRKKARKTAKLGYFAVPFKNEEVPQLVTSLGQNHQVLGKLFDTVSPMLYHRMIKKPASYISEYVSWLNKQTGKPILPIIQVKDMPDDLADQLTETKLSQAFKGAIKPPSEGVCFFHWTQALETNKTKIISQLFTSTP